MILIFTSIIPLAIVTLLWRHHRRKRLGERFATSVKQYGELTAPSVLNYSIRTCQTTFCELMGTISNGDKIQIGRVCRAFATEHDEFKQYIHFSRDTKVKDNINLIYLWDATLKLVEAGRRLVLHPEYDCSRPEVLILIFGSKSLSDCKIIEPSELTEICKLNKTKVSEMIRNYKEYMRPNDYEDGSVKYDFMLFLFYLQSFMISLENNIKSHGKTGALKS